MIDHLLDHATKKITILKIRLKMNRGSPPEVFLRKRCSENMQQIFYLLFDLFYQQLVPAATTLQIFLYKYWKSLLLTLSWWRPLSYRNQSIDLLGKSMDWFLYDSSLRHERVKETHRQKAQSNKTPAFTKISSMGIWFVGTSNQLFIR